MRTRRLFIACAACAAAATMAPGTLRAQLGEPLSIKGPKCPVRLNEVMIKGYREYRYGPYYGEFVELYNTSETQEVDIAGWTFSDDHATNAIVDYTGPFDIGVEGTVIPPRGYALIVDMTYDGTYNGAYNSRMEENGALDNCIMVCASHSYLGLADREDSVTIKTTWPLYRRKGSPKQTMSVEWDESWYLYEDPMAFIEWSLYDSAWILHGDDSYTPGYCN